MEQPFDNDNYSGAAVASKNSARFVPGKLFYTSEECESVFGRKSLWAKVRRHWEPKPAVHRHKETVWHYSELLKVADRLMAGEYPE